MKGFGGEGGRRDVSALREGEENWNFIHFPVSSLCQWSLCVSCFPFSYRDLSASQHKNYTARLYWWHHRDSVSLPPSPPSSFLGPSPRRSICVQWIPNDGRSVSSTVWDVGDVYLVCCSNTLFNFIVWFVFEVVGIPQGGWRGQSSFLTNTKFFLFFHHCLHHLSLSLPPPQVCSASLVVCEFVSSVLSLFVASYSPEIPHYFFHVGFLCSEGC